jgi:hypothetical protein
MVHEPGPALEAVLSSQRELRVGECRLGRACLVRTHAGDSGGVAVAPRAQQILGLLAKLREGRTMGKAGGRAIGHGDLLSTAARVRTTSLKEDRMVNGP